MGKLIYENHLAKKEDIEGFVLEGQADISFPEGAMRLKSVIDPSEGQKANFVLWCPVSFPSDVCIEWEFKPIKEPGLAIMFFAAKGRSGVPVLDNSLAKRTGEYPQYHSGDINAFHVSYFRMRELSILVTSGKATAFIWWRRVRIRFPMLPRIQNGIEYAW